MPSESILRPEHKKLTSGVLQTSFLKQIRRSRHAYRPQLTTDLSRANKRIANMSKKIQEAIILSLNVAHCCVFEDNEVPINTTSLAAKNKKPIQVKKYNPTKQPVYDRHGTDLGRTPDWSNP